MSQARRRLALKTSAFALLGAGAFGVLPAVAALAVPQPYVYTCGLTAAQGAQGAQPTETVTFMMELVTPGPVTPNAVVTVRWDIKQPTPTATNGVTITPSPLPAPTDIATGATLAAQGTVSPSGSPLPSTSIVASAAATAQVAVTAGSPMPLQTLAATVRPTASGTVGLEARGFDLMVNNATVYNCAPASKGPTANLVVATGSPTSTGTTPPPTTPTPTPTTSTPRPTTTKTVITTVTPKSPTPRKSQTPKDGADTGAGGDSGPDGRMFLVAGSVLVMAAGAGGLFLRRRTIKG